MKRITTITDKEILGRDGLSDAAPRLTARAVLKNGNRYAVMYAEKFGLYSLPGGGVDEGEGVLTALKREILEETGCTCGEIIELGKVVENRAQADYTQCSYYYVVTVKDIGKPCFTDDEKRNKTTLQWHTLSETVALINGFQPSTYQQHYLKARDVAALNAYVTQYIFAGAPPCQADAVFVVGGSLPEAAELAADLYRRGYVSTVIIGGKYSIKRGAFPLSEYATEYDFYHTVLLQNGVKENDIYGENESGYTRQNAKLAKRVADENGLAISNAMIVCKSFHARRCLLLYQMYFPHVTFTAVTFDGFGISRDNWCLTAEGRERVIGEIKRIEEQCSI